MATREIRVFVSSTFLDMQDERDRLVKFVFPELRRMCEQRGVVWSEIDLRWGITDEQKAEGRVLPICLQEIRRCSHFIGILGDNCGTTADVPPALLEREPWLREHAGRSVTELEILYGVLLDPSMARHAFFYFRKAGVPNGGPPQTPEAAERLSHLKKRIRESKFPVREFTTSRSLGDLVLTDFTALIQRACPALPASAVEAEERAQAAFRESRARFYVPRQPDESGIGPAEMLNRYATSAEVPLMVRGEPGIGKSALLADWATKYGKENPDAVVISHFTAASADSASWIAIAHRIIRALDERLGTGNAPVASTELRVALAEALNAAARKSRIVLVLDGLNQLEDFDGAPQLAWLPPVIASNVRVVLSSAEGPPVEEAVRRGWNTWQLGRLDSAECGNFIRVFLDWYGRSMPDAMIASVANGRHSGNPLFLLTLLDELRVHGSHGTLADRLEYYLDSADAVELFDKVLRRYEEDYQEDRPGLVADSCSTIALARRGIDESELRQMLGTNMHPMPAAFWSPLSLAMGASLIVRSGLIGFSHDHFREAVRRRYIRGTVAESAARQRLMTYFENRPRSYRRTDELPWQMDRAGAWDDLASYLGGQPSLTDSWKRDEADVRRYWSDLERNTRTRRGDVYAQAEQAAAANPGYAWTAAILLGEGGAMHEALRVRGALDAQLRSPDKIPAFTANLAMAAHLHYALGEYEEALRLHERRERTLRRFGPSRELAAAMGDMGIILLETGRDEAALALFRHQERICFDQNDYFGLQTSLGNQALALKAGGRIEEALALLERQETLCRREGYILPLSNCLGNTGEIRYQQKRYSEATDYLRKQEVICSELGYRPGLIRSIGDQALVLAAIGDYSGACAAHQREEEMARHSGDAKAIAVSLVNQADLAGVKMGDSARGLALLRNARKEMGPYQFPAVGKEADNIERKIRAAGGG